LSRQLAATGTVLTVFEYETGLCEADHSTTNSALTKLFSRRYATDIGFKYLVA